MFKLEYLKVGLVGLAFSATCTMAVYLLLQGFIATITVAGW